MRRIIKKCLLDCVAFFRERYHKLKALRLRNKTPTIISNNCIGGVIYHDLGLKFYSPTINLWMRAEEYLCFLENMKAFVSADVEEVFEAGIQYPIGRLSLPNGLSVRLYFMHYANFDEARQKWNIRKKRINYDNLYAIMEFPGKNIAEDRYISILNRFNQTAIPRKVFLTAVETIDAPNTVIMDFYRSVDYLPGKILLYKTRYSIKRYLDDFDYIGFLNS